MRIALLAASLALMSLQVSAGEAVQMPHAPTKPAAAACKADPGWDDPTPPRHIFGNSWYVGTCAISSILIASPQGHVLIDGAAEKGGERIAENLRALGVNPRDIRYILVSHEHSDHVGGIAHLQRVGGATVLTREPAVTALKNGVTDRRDPQFDFTRTHPFPRIANVQAIKAGGELRVGGRSIRNLPMPGHTPGGSGWTWRECEGSTCANIVYADSVTAIADKGYRYGAPGALGKPLATTLSLLERQPCDILLKTHADGGMLARIDGKAPLIDPTACKSLARDGREALAKRLAEERGGTSP